MIIHKNVPLADQLAFLRANVCDVDPDGLRTAGCGEAAAAGLLGFQQSLQCLFADPGSLDGKDDTDKYNGLISAMALLYCVFALGRLSLRGGAEDIVVGKSELLDLYKRGSIAKRLEWLGRGGFEGRWIGEDGQAGPQNTAAWLAVSHAGEAGVIAATKGFVGAIETLEDRSAVDPELPFLVYSTDTVCDRLGLFIKADYPTAFGLRALEREPFDARRDDVLAVLGEPQRRMWLELAETLVELGYGVSGFCHRGVSPAWCMSFALPRSRPLLMATVSYERLFIELTLPADRAEAVIRSRAALSESIRASIDDFQCDQCRPDCNGRKLRNVDNVALCTARAEARRICQDLQTPEDFDSVRQIATMATTGG